jgi:EmrB/QacA subfamily drug resistance transporter
MASHSTPSQPLTPAETRAIMIGLMVAMFPGALDTTIIGPAMPTIGRELRDVEHLPWIVTSYLLVSTAVTPLYGKLSDIHGRRVMLMWAIGIFAAGSVFCALAPTVILLALARAVQAIGGGGLISLAMTIIGDIVPPRERPKFQIYTSIMWTGSSLLGPVLGGFLAEMWHWSLIFWINLPLCVAAFLMTNGKLKKAPRHERPHALDFAGAFLLVLASVLIQLMLSWGGTRYAWTSAPVLALLIASGLATAAFIWRLKTAAEPLIPLSLLSNKVVLTATSSVGLTMAVFVALSIYVPVYFETILGMSATQSGLALLPLMVCTTIGALAAGRAMAYLDRYKFVPLIGLLLGGLAMLPLFIWPTGLSITMIEVLLSIVAIGVGAVFPVTTVSVQNAVSSHELGTGTALITFLRNLGAAGGVAVFGTIVIGGSGQAPEMAGALGLTADAAFIEQFSYVFLAGALGLLAAALVLWTMEERPLAGRMRSGAIR